MTTIFPLQESKIEIRGRLCTVRELTHQRRAEISKLIVEDKFRGPALWASAGCVDPPITEEQCSNESAEIVDKLARETMKLCGLLRDEEGDGKKD